MSASSIPAITADAAVRPLALEVVALAGVPLVQPGADLVELTCAALERSGQRLRDRDVLVFAQKVVSKAEGRIVDLRNVRPSAAALELAAEVDKDPRLVEVILGESRRVVRQRRGLLIVEHKRGFVCANAGVDRSNVDPALGAEPVLLLPEDPDRSAQLLRDGLMRRYDKEIAIVVSDSFGRAWRRGTTGTALGAAGLPAVLDMRGLPDLFGRALQTTETGFADEIAAAASLLMGQAGQALPIVLVRGLQWDATAAPAASLVRDAQHDLFR